MKATIIDYGYNGEGIAKINGKVCFIPKTIVGEEVEFSCIKENSKFCFGELEKLIKPSEIRTTPSCKYFDQCGGCCFQHIPYSEELKIKKQLFLKEFSKVEKLEDIKINYDEEFCYRNKIRLAVKNKNLGFFKEKSKDFLPVDKCLLVNSEVNNLISKVNEYLKTTNLVMKEVIFYDFEDKFAVDFISDSKIKKLDFPFVDNIMINHKGKSIFFTENNLQLEFNGNQFRQINNKIANFLYEKISSMIKNEKVINAYSGAGLLSALIAKKAKHVYGIELNHFSHLSAEQLKNKNNIQNLTNICGYAEKEIAKYSKDCDCIVLDPPRAGCDKTLIDCLLTNLPKKIIYISCNPATLVRDLLLLKDIYKISSSELFDMFPKTANIESMVVLDKKLTK